MSAAWDAPAAPALSEAPCDAAPPAFAALCGEVAATLARPWERKRNLCRLAEALGALGGGAAALCTPRPNGVLLYEVGTGALARLEGDLVPVEGTLEGEALAAGEARGTDNLRADPRAYLAVSRALPNGPALALPLGVGDECAGVALLANERAGAEPGAGAAGTLPLAATLVAGALRTFDEHEGARASRAVLEAWRSARARDAAGAKGVLRAVRHELNTPVAVLLGNLQLCRSADPAEWKLPPAELWAAIRVGVTQLEELSRLLRALEESDAPVGLDAQGRFIAPAASG